MIRFVNLKINHLLIDPTHGTQYSFDTELEAKTFLINQLQPELFEYMVIEEKGIVKQEDVTCYHEEDHNHE